MPTKKRTPARRPQKTKRPAAPRRKRGFSWKRLLFKLSLASLLFYAIVAAVYYSLALRYNLSELHHLPERTVVYDASNKILGRFSGENRIVIPFDDVPDSFVKALLAREDSRFYQHLGVDPIGIARAAARNLLMGGIRQGGSTITQQLARNSFPLGGRNIHRKLLEAALSFRIETEITKEEILESYINRIYFGSGTYGLEAASQTYFDKPASKLTLAESALLAAIIRSPTRTSPFNNPSAALRQRNLVLERMQELDWISQEQCDSARKQPLKLSKKPRIDTSDNWAMDIVRRELETILERVGYDESGLCIYSTIDPALQSETEHAISGQLARIESLPNFPHPPRSRALQNGDSDYLQAAALALDHRNGAILAVAGGRDYDTSNFNRTLFGFRQAGSVVKPFVMAQAFAKGLSPSDPISDAPLEPNEIPAKYGRYSPENSDDRYGESRPASDALLHSRNTMTVRIGLSAGISSLLEILRRSGICPNPPEFPSVFLGSFETTLRDLTSAMTAFPNSGNQVHPFAIRKITDSSGRLLYQSKQIRTPLLDPQPSKQVTEILEDVMVRGTAASSQRLGLRGRAAGKTGTTNEFHDAWFVGFSGNLTMGVWAGFDQPKTIYHGGGGAQIALPIWVDVVSSPAAKKYR